ncbi:MAG TPA: hypothetical protein VKU87_04280 [Thermomicrobiaceae bacterium]|nr:hypothetical protein [Thermomicrobiaceae bacterium]
MARSIHDLVNAALDAAVAAGKLTADERGSLKQFAAYKGTADEADPRRYYLNAQLSEYVEVALGNVIAEVALAGDESPLVLVVMRPDAAVERHLDVSRGNRRVQLTESTEASFLTGEIASRHLSRSRLFGRRFPGRGGAAGYPMRGDRENPVPTNDVQTCP